MGYARSPKVHSTRGTLKELTHGQLIGLVPFWTKRAPDYGSTMKTINCRDDSLYEDRGMWTTMKRRKRCLIIAQGFYEWLKKNDGREKIPHFVKRKDGQLMCFAGLWDCVKYEGSDEKLYTYTIITTDSNKQLQFLHDRMPVILDNGSEAMRIWLDPKRSEWSKELQGLLKPYQGELEIYPVTKDVGKVGNNSPTFIVPLDSKENKNNIANFFANAKKAAPNKQAKSHIDTADEKAASDRDQAKSEAGDSRETVDDNSTEDNAPKPVPSETPARPIKQEEISSTQSTLSNTSPRGLKREHKAVSPSKASPSKPPNSKRIRSATSNGTVAKGSPKAGDGSKKITAFFGK